MVKGSGATKSLESLFHKTVKKVTEDVESMKFNTAIAALMTLINAIYDEGSLTKDELSVFVRLLSPFAPHVCEEIWEFLGEKGFCSASKWPEWDESKTVDDTVEYAVQVLGKLRAVISVSASADRDTVIAAAKSDEKVASMVSGNTIVKEIFVPGKLVNFVIK